MPNKDYISFYKGIAKDDYVAMPGSYLYGRNIDGSLFGYGATIGRKSEKVIEVSHPIYDMSNRVTASESNNVMVGHDGTNGYIYKLNSADSTPSVTVTTSQATDNLLVACPYLSPGYYFLGTRAADLRRYAVHHASNSALTMSYNTYDTGNFFNSSIPPYIIEKSLVMVGAGSRVFTMNTVPSVSAISVVSGTISAIASSGTTILLYTNDSRVYTWNGVATATTGSKSTGYKSVKSGTSGGEVFTTTESGVMLTGNGYEFQELYKKRKTLKAEDNSEYYNLLDFSTAVSDKTTGNAIQAIEGDIYFIEGTKRIGKLASVRSDMARGYHTILDTNHAGTVIDKIYCIREINGNLYFAYKAGTYYGVDKMDMSSLSSLPSGDIILPVFRGVPDEVNKEARIKFTVSNTSGNKRAKIYKRIDQGAWELIRTINESTDVIFREKISTANREFTEYQLKVTLENSDQDDTPPMIHSLRLKYNVIKS